MYNMLIQHTRSLSRARAPRARVGASPWRPLLCCRRKVRGANIEAGFHPRRGHPLASTKRARSHPSVLARTCILHYCIASSAYMYCVTLLGRRVLSRQGRPGEIWVKWRVGSRRQRRNALSQAWRDSIFWDNAHRMIGQRVFSEFYTIWPLYS